MRFCWWPACVKRRRHMAAETRLREAVNAAATDQGATLINSGCYAHFMWEVKRDFQEAYKHFCKAFSVPPLPGPSGEQALATSKAAATTSGNPNGGKKSYPSPFAGGADHLSSGKRLARALKTPPPYLRRPAGGGEPPLRKPYGLLLGLFGTMLEHPAVRRFDEAEACFRRALELDAVDPLSVGNLAVLLHRVRKDYDAAERMYKRAIAAHPSHASVLVKYGNLLKHQRRDYDGAEMCYKRAIEANPQHADSLGNYAVLPVELLQNTFSDRTRWIAQLPRPDPHSCVVLCNVMTGCTAAARTTTAPSACTNGRWRRTPRTRTTLGILRCFWRTYATTTRVPRRCTNAPSRATRGTPTAATTMP